MGEMEDKLSAILNNPQMMSQIMSMAQAMGANSSNDAPPQPQPQPSAPKPPAPAPSLSIDPMMLQQLSGFAGQGAINKEQQALLKALSPFLQKDRLGKLERAMRAAKIARFASSALGQNGLMSLLGR